MFSYSSILHRQLMDASEIALQDATESPLPREARIATTILTDARKYREWECRHADLLLPVAAHSARKRQVVALRQAEIHLIHRRALFTYLQAHDLTDDQRETVFRLFHSTLDYKEAILTEHRQYMLAVSSHISNDHLIDVMQDETSVSLLRQYETVFGRYFEMKCYIAGSSDSYCVELIRSSIRDVYGLLLRIRRRMETEPPAVDFGDFHQQELLARSSRHEIQNYLYV